MRITCTEIHHKKMNKTPIRPVDKTELSRCFCDHAAF